MKRFGKILLGALGILVLLVVAAMIALPLLVDPNDYKAQINRTIESEIGRQVTLKGDIDWSVFPWLGITLGEVDVANAKGFSETPMAEMQSAQVSVRLLPLLHRDIEVGTVSLEGLRLRLARNAQGRSNWADIAEHLAASQDGEKERQQPDASNGDTHDGFELSSLQVGAIEIHDAAVSWQDATSGADYRATGVKLMTGRLSDGEPVRLEFGGDFAAPGQQVGGHVDLVSRVEPDIADQLYRFSDLKLNVLATGKAVPNGRQQATLGGRGELDLGAGRFKLTGLALQVAGVNMTAEVDGSGLNGTPAYAGSVTVKPFDPRTVLQELAIEPPETRNADVLSSAGFDAQFDATNDSVKFSQILASLDSSTLKGSANLSHFDRPAIGFDLNLDHLNVDDYLAPGSAEQTDGGEPANTGGGGQQEQAEIDLSALKNLRLDGKFAAGALTAANIHVTNARLAVKARDGVLTIEPLTADLYQGRVKMSARVDASKDTPRYRLKGNLDGLQFAPLLKDVAGTERVSALANMNIDVSTAGKQVAAMKQALDGGFGFDLRDGAFNGFNLARIIASARSRLTGGGGGAGAGNAGVAKGEQTPFNRFAATFNIKDGIMAGRDLNLATKVIDASGTGSYDLAKNALDYTVKAKVPEKASGDLAKLAGLSVPIQLTGNLMSPDYKLDVSSALRGVAEQRLQQQKSKLRDKLREKLQERSKDRGGDLGNTVQQGIRGLFGGKKGADGKQGSDR